MIFEGPQVRSGRRVRDTYAWRAKKLPQTMVCATSSKPLMGHVSQPDDIVFTQADASWVHNPLEDALVITTKVANSLIHRLLVDNGSAVNILYWDAYQMISLRRADLTLMISPLYRSIGDSVIPEGIIKLAVTLGEPPQSTTVVIDFLAVKCPSAFNGVLGRPLLKALKAMASIHCLTMKFPTATEIGQVRGRQLDSRECYNKSLKLTEKRTQTTPSNRGRNDKPRANGDKHRPPPTRRWVNFRARKGANWDPGGPQRT